MLTRSRIREILECCIFPGDYVFIWTAKRYSFVPLMAADYLEKIEKLADKPVPPPREGESLLDELERYHYQRVYPGKGKISLLMREKRRQNTLSWLI
jgi:hypothetical protein